MAGSLRGRRSEEMIKSNTSSSWGLEYLLSTRGVMAIEVPQNKEISREGKKEPLLLSVKQQTGGA